MQDAGRDGRGAREAPMRIGPAVEEEELSARRAIEPWCLRTPAAPVAEHGDVAGLPDGEAAQRSPVAAPQLDDVPRHGGPDVAADLADGGTGPPARPLGDRWSRAGHDDGRDAGHGKNGQS